MRLARGAKVTAADSGEHIWFNRSLLTIRVTSADTNNAYDLVEVTGQGGNSTPLHIDPTCEKSRIL
jgi:hypothetical protein